MHVYRRDAARSGSLRALMRTFVVAGAMLSCVAGAHSPDTMTRDAAAKAQPPRPAVSRTSAPVVTVRSTAPGQTGYVHFFVITSPDGERETQVGLELGDGTIAWSFPNAGVTVSPFIRSGEMDADGAIYRVEHLYGLKPFPDAASMATLRRELDGRVREWIDRKTPYCDEEDPTDESCVSCLGFVLRVLYPQLTPQDLVLPGDFRSARSDLYTTEDFLMYLAGVRLEAPRSARLQRIKGLKIPATMRKELVRIATTAPRVAGDRRTTRAQSRTGIRSTAQTRKPAPRRGS